MTKKSAENQFKEIYPKATIEMQKTNGGDRYYLVRKTRTSYMPIGDGKTKREAWENAFKRIQ